ncbi:MAG: glycoside hydrolase [Treponema sp.]|jgi:hypothetical protein|nr:glycoside hydrolase [Treponema sp.]
MKKIVRSTVLILVLLALEACSSDPGPVAEAETPEISESEIMETDVPAGAEPEESLFLPPPEESLPVSGFREVWGYLLADREDALKPDMPLTDIGYFGAEIDYYGKLTDVPNRFKVRFGGRVHLVVACNSYSLTHFVLKENSAEREALIRDLLNETRRFDGLQIDFENIPKQDGPAFRSFLAELRRGLGSKAFTIALPARTRHIADDVFDYDRILPLVDRILVMAYDEHWSTSAPGPVASLPWCKRVAEYAVRTIDSEKLIMGLPFYGRAWGNTNPSRAYIHSGIEELKTRQEVRTVERENGIPTFQYEIPVGVKVYYEDAYSLAVRMKMYRDLGVKNIGFWRIGQETPEVWNLITVEE